MAHSPDTTAHRGQDSQARPATPEPPGSPGTGCSGAEGQGRASPVGQSWTGHRGQPQGTDLSGLFEGHWGTGLGHWGKGWPRGTYPGDSPARELTCIFHCPLCPPHPAWGGL